MKRPVLSGCQPPTLSAPLDSWGSRSNCPYVQFTFDLFEIHTIIGRTALHSFDTAQGSG